jgi:hypothetical protein
MPEENNRDNEVFIDADAGFSNEKNSYETIILNQINACVKVLSREMTGGQVVHKAGPTGVEKYIEDVRELVINHIDALRMLMCVYIKADNKKSLDNILKEIDDYKKDMGDKKVLIPGQGDVQIKNIKGMNVDNPIWKEFIHFKALKYREIFEVLVSAYNDKKAEIRALEEE